MHHCAGIQITSLYFWVFLSAVFFGFGAAVFTVNVAKKNNPQRAKKVRPILLSLFFTCGFLCLAGAAIFSRFSFVVENPRAIGTFGAAVLGIGFLGYRFKKVVGVFFVTLIIGIIIISAIVTRFWICLEEDGPILAFQLLAKDEHEVVVELSSPDRFSAYYKEHMARREQLAAGTGVAVNEIHAIQREYASLIFEAVHIHEALFFIRSDTLIRLIGFKNTTPPDIPFDLLAYEKYFFFDYQQFIIPISDFPLMNRFHIVMQKEGLQIKE